VAKVHKAYIDQCSLMAQAVKKKDIEGFVGLMRKAAVHFGDTESALRRSDKLIGTKIAEHEELVRSIGNECALKHIYSGVVHTGIVKKVTPRTVVMERNGKKIEFLIENIRLLNEKELYSWKVANLKNVTRDISVYIPFASEGDIIKSVITGVGGVVSANIIDIYNRQNIQSVTYRLTIFGDRDAATVQGNVEKLLRGIGCTIR
jgi:prephenate dehydrogenase